MSAPCRLSVVGSWIVKKTSRSSRKVTARGSKVIRSEEHTSELQSLAYLVCRLLLEKKKPVNSACLQEHPLKTNVLCDVGEQYVTALCGHGLSPHPFVAAVTPESYSLRLRAMSPLF